MTVAITMQGLASTTPRRQDADPAAHRTKCHAVHRLGNLHGCMVAVGNASALVVCMVSVTAQRQITAMEDIDLAAAVIKSPADKKEYRLLRLPNGLNALLIHDPSINVNQAS